MSRIVTFSLSDRAVDVLRKMPWGEKSKLVNDYIESLDSSPKEQVAIANPNGAHDSVPSGSHKRSKNSDSEETKSEPPETTASPPSTTKSTTPPTQNILRKLTSSAQS